jgi:hypothetical protein
VRQIELSLQTSLIAWNERLRRPLVRPFGTRRNLSVRSERKRDAEGWCLQHELFKLQSQLQRSEKRARLRLASEV